MCLCVSERVGEGEKEGENVWVKTELVGIVELFFFPYSFSKFSCKQEQGDTAETSTPIAPQASWIPGRSNVALD